MRATFAHRLNRLFDTIYPIGKQRPYTSAEVVAAVRESGTTMSAPYLSQLRSGNRDNPSQATMAALAHFFGVEPAYFVDEDYADSLDEELEALARVRDGRPQREHIGPDSQSASVATRSQRPVETARSVDPTFTRRLNALLGRGRSVTGDRFTHEELAGALQADGIALTARDLRRLCAGDGPMPTATTLAAIAFQFDVSPAYFTDDAYADEVEREWSETASTQFENPRRESAFGLSPRVASTTVVPPVDTTGVVALPPHTGSASDAVVMDLPMFGRLVSGLSSAATLCLEGNPPRTAQVGRLTQLLTIAGALLGSAQEAGLAVPRPFLEKALLAWSAGGIGLDDGHASYVRIADLL